jgi:tetratricopeptide (TPR) repeat protein
MVMTLSLYRLNFLAFGLRFSRRMEPLREGGRRAMTCSRSVSASLLTLLIWPAFCVAQSNDAPANSAATVSLRELSVPDRARKDFNEGTRLLGVKDWPGSLDKFQSAIKSFPNFYEAYYRMGISNAELKREPEAESAFRQSIELSDGHYAPPYFGLALILCDKKHDFVEAEAFVRAGLRVDPSDAAGYYALAWVFYLTNRLLDAEQSIHQTLSYQPDYEAANRLLNQIRLRQNREIATVKALDPSFE